MRKSVWVSFLLAFAMIAAACGSDTTTEDTEATTEATSAPTDATTTTAATTTTTEAATTTTEAMVAIGSEDNPIQVLFVPSVSAEEIIAGGEILEAFLEENTGLFFDVDVPTSYASVIQEMCAAPDSTIGFIPAQAYVLASDLCGVDIALKSIRFGYDVYWTQFIVGRDSGIETLADLAGKTWAYPDAGSTSGFLVPSGLLLSLGIEVGESFEAGGHSATARAIYNGEADFGTTFYSPQIDIDGTPVWDGSGEGADLAGGDLGECGVVSAADADGKFGEGDLVCGSVEIRDARRNIREEAPDVIDTVKVIDVSDPIPNDGMAFGPDVADDIRTAVITAILAFADANPDDFSAAFDAYSWSGVAETTDAEFDSIRALLQALGFSVDDL